MKQTRSLQTKLTSPLQRYRHKVDNNGNNKLIKKISIREGVSDNRIGVTLCYVMLCREVGLLRGEPLDLAIWVVLRYLIPLALCLGT